MDFRLRVYSFILTFSAYLIAPVVGHAQFCKPAGSRIAADVASLIWTGYLDSGLHERRPAEIEKAIQRFRMAQPNPVPHARTLTTAERTILCKAAEARKAAIGLDEYFVDQKTGVGVAMPINIVKTSVPTPIKNGSQWRSENGEFEMGVLIYPITNQTAASFYNRHRQSVPGRNVVWELVSPPPSSGQPLAEFTIEADDLKVDPRKGAVKIRSLIIGKEGISTAGEPELRAFYLTFPQDKMQEFGPLANIMSSRLALFSKPTPVVTPQPQQAAVSSGPQPAKEMLSKAPTPAAQPTAAPQVLQTPAAVSATGAAPIDCNDEKLIHVEKTEDGESVEGHAIFVGTNRSRVLDRRRSSDRLWGDTSGDLRFGTARAWFSKLKPTKGAAPPIDFTDIPEGRFKLALTCAVKEAREKVVYIFIHGYNNTEKDAGAVVARLMADMDFSGVPAMFSWPSRGDVTNWEHIKAEQYRQDSQKAAAAHVALEQYIRLIADTARLGAPKIRLVLLAHSMGNRPLLHALQLLKRSSNGLGQLGIDQVIFSAPDVDDRAFLSALKDVQYKNGPHFTLYASKNDKALWASRSYNDRSVPRAGSVDARWTDRALQPAVASDLISVDVSNLTDRFLSLNHDPHGNQILVGHIKRLIVDGGEPEQYLTKLGLGVSQKFIPNRTKEEGNRYWVIDPDQVRK